MENLSEKHFGKELNTGSAIRSSFALDLFGLEEIEEDFIPCIKYIPTSNLDEWEPELTTWKANTGSGLKHVLDTSSFWTLSSGQLKFMYASSKLFFEDQQYADELQNYLTDSKEQIALKIKRAMSNGTLIGCVNIGNEIDRRVASLAKERGWGLITSNYHLVAIAHVSNLECIFVLHKNQIEKLKKDFNKFKNDFKLKVKKELKKQKHENI